jgi:hypothetical protein
MDYPPVAIIPRVCRSRAKATQVKNFVGGLCSLLMIDAVSDKLGKESYQADSKK